MKTNLDKIINKIISSERILFILCGLPYSGKTYFSDQICTATHCTYVSIDHILTRLGYDWNVNKLPDAAGWDKVFEISYAETAAALGKGENVLYDSTNHTRQSRDRLRKVAEEVGAKAYVIWIDSAPEIIRRRWEENKRSKKRFVLSQELLEQTINAFEPPSEDEGVLVINNNE